MFHKSKMFDCALAAPMSSVIEPVEQIISEDVDGVTVERAVYIPVDLASRKAELSLPKASEYTLENLIKAGVDLKRLDVLSMFASTDPFDAQLANDAKAVELFKQLQNEEKIVEQVKDEN